MSKLAPNVERLVSADKPRFEIGQIIDCSDVKEVLRGLVESRPDGTEVVHKDQMVALSGGFEAFATEVGGSRMKLEDVWKNVERAED